MAGSLPSASPAPSRTREASELKSRNVSVAGHRTSVRLERPMWEALREVCAREQASASALVTAIAEERGEASLTAAIRAFLLIYFRAAATEEGHRAARHGVLPRRWRLASHSPL